MRLKRKVAIITGAARGIGRSISAAFAREGAMVVIVDILSEQGQATADAINGDGGRAISLTADVSDLAAHELIINAALEQFGRIDILVNNAAIEIREPFLEASPEIWDATLAVNLKGPYFLAQKAARVMMRYGGGKILNIASIHDSQPMRNISIYSITKGGMMMMTKSLALELAEHRINVNAISPGAVLTDLNRDVLSDETYREKVVAKIPWGRIGETDDIAGAAIFLASAESDYITGATIYMDGGLLLR